jgi:hypothetical protein
LILSLNNETYINYLNREGVGEMENITLEDIESAYLRLKRAIYYENNISLHLKMQLAEFENEKNFLDEDERIKYFEKFKEKLNKYDSKEALNYFNKLFLEIKYKKVIKKLNEKVDKNIYKIIEKNLENPELNSILEKKIKEDSSKNDISYNYFIDCPIEFHIISVLWIMKYGYELDSKLDRNNSIYSYGYRLDIKKEKLNNIDINFEKIIREKSIFKKYYEQYQKWKYNGLKEVEHIREKNENVVILCLDLKRFYYFINRKKLKDKIRIINAKILEANLTKIILKINEKYAEKLIEEVQNNEKEFSKIDKNNILPIGLYSSTILANIYLKELDDLILNETRPNYYGRYVDDIFLVYEEYSLENLKNEREYFFNKFNNQKKFQEYVKKNNIKFNFDKQKLYILEKDKGKNKILELEESILEKASTFAFLPNEKEIRKLYKKISISSNEEEKEKKYDVSVYLSKLLIIFSYLEKKKDIDMLEEDVNEILYFFDDENIVKYYIYYEKIFLLLVINGNIRKIQKFYNKIIEYFKNFLSNQNEKYDIEEYLINSLCFALSLNPSLISQLEKLENNNIRINIREKVEKIINSNLFKQNLINYPLLNYTNLRKNKENLDLDKINFFDEPSINTIKKVNLDLEKVKLSPRFLHFSEFNNFYLKKTIVESYNSKITNFSEKIKILYDEELKKIKPDLEENFNFLFNKKNKLNFFKIKSTQSKNYKKIKIGIANLLVKENLEKNILKTTPSYLEKEELIKILNLAKRNNVNILVFPEISIPYEWITLLNKFSRENQMVITGGFIHLFNQNVEYNSKKIKNIFNFLFTILPFETQKYKNSFITIRLKNYYSPMEESIINGYSYTVPISDKRYDIFSWEGVHFSNFNCFELSDIEGRSRLKNYIDLLIASVYNKDINYFENILESTCRDLHIFVAQSNTSIYGNCEILQPSSKDSMVLASIKGGKNSNLLIEEIDIESLRNFQLQKYYLQKRENNIYKPTPSGMDINIVNLRKDNKLDEYFNKIEKSKK